MNWSPTNPRWSRRFSGLAFGFLGHGVLFHNSIDTLVRHVAANPAPHYGPGFSQA